MRVAVHGGWTVRAAGPGAPATVDGRAIPATVPGVVHLDLLAAGLIPDPYLDEGERLVGWIGDVDWRYETTFSWAGADDGDEIDLVALGLDTVAEVELDGVVIARTANMHRSYRIPVTDRLRPGRGASSRRGPSEPGRGASSRRGPSEPGRHTLAVTFAAPVPAAQRASELLGPRPHVNTHPYNGLRKMASSYGWDWGPDLATVGIWRPLYLETWRGARIASVRPLVDIDRTAGVLRAHVDLQRSSTMDGVLSVEVSVAGNRARVEVPAGETAATVEVRVEDARLWWPAGFGDQPLYDVTATLSGPEGPLDVWSGRIGFRTVTLDTTGDDTGTPFTLSVNGVPVFARGVNWVPGDCFPSRVTRSRYAELLGQARAANINLVRVWGGGIYESDDFYDVCDELGLLVWQDFLFACAAYAEEEPLRAEVTAEAREAVTRLSPHPSLALWNGGNENIWGHEDWGWKETLAGRTWGWGFYTELLPSIVDELDPGRPYSPGSPYSFAAGKHPNDPVHGTMHIWDVWNQLDYTQYRRYRPRFVAEFGFQGPPAWATLTRAVHDDPLRPDSPAVLLHQKADDGNGKLIRGLAGHLPVPETFEDWHWATSLNQARAVAFGIEHLRALAPHCMGAVVWQLNDVWPAVSWSAVDGDGRRKPLWYALRHSFSDRLLTVQPRDDGLTLFAVNDSPDPWCASVLIQRRGIDGSILAERTERFDVPARGTAAVTLPAELAVPADPAGELLVAGAGDLRAVWYFVPDIEVALPEPGLDATVAAVPGGYQVTVTARTLIRDLALLADRVAPDAVADTMLLTLLPGEVATFTLRTAAELAARELLDPLVLRSANQLGYVRAALS
jgi:beta-mannosidase